MTTPSETIEIYCMKCKAKTGSKDIEAITMKNGRPATRSICTECGTKKFPHRRPALTGSLTPPSWRWTLA